MKTTYSAEDYSISAVQSGFSGKVNLLKETAYGNLRAIRVSADSFENVLTGTDEPAESLNELFFRSVETIRQIEQASRMSVSFSPGRENPYEVKQDGAFVGYYDKKGLGELRDDILSNHTVPQNG